MDVTEAVATRKSIRAFLDTPVEDDTLKQLLTAASRAPSGGNVQPWVIYAITSGSMPAMLEHLDAAPPVEEPGYDIYPAKLWEPYRTNRYALGEAMYETIGVGRDDKEGRMRQFANNGKFFGAPAAIFCYIDKRMGPPQWSDLGMFLQTFMLLAEEAGMQTCPQEYWTVRQNAVGEFVGAPEELMLFCGVAIGHADPDAQINTLESQRQPLEEWCTIL